MDMQILNESGNPLLRRKEIQLVVKSDVTPSRNDVLNEVCKKFSCKPEVVRIKKISGAFGVKSFEINVEIYETENDKENYSPTIKKKDINLENSLKEKNKPQTEEKTEAE
jgi:ribosomal protein S24E